MSISLCLSRKRIAFPHYLSKKKEVRDLFVDFRVTTGCGDFPEDANCVLSCASKPLWEATAGCSGASEKTTHIRFPFPPCQSRKRQSWQHVFEVTTGCGDFKSLYREQERALLMMMMKTLLVQENNVLT